MLNLIHKTTNNHAKDKLKKKTQLQQDGCYTIVRLSFETPSSSFTVQLVYLLLGHYSNDEVRWSNIACTKCYQYSNCLETVVFCFASFNVHYYQNLQQWRTNFIVIQPIMASVLISVFIQRCYLAFIIFFN